MSDIYSLDSRRYYPPIIRSGSVPFTKTGLITVELTAVQPNERYLVYIEESGYIRRPAYYDSLYNGTNLVYTSSNKLCLYMGDFDNRSGIVHWRAYYDKI